MAQLYAQAGEVGRALEWAREAAEIFGRIESPHAELARQLVARLESGGGSGPSPEAILEQFGPVIAAAVAGARGDRQGRAAVEGLFEMLGKNGWRIEKPIRRIWAGERNESELTEGLDGSDALIVRAILGRL